MSPQSKYQVRFDWGTAGAAAVSDGVDVIIWVDQLAATEQTLPDFPTVVGGNIQNSTAVAEWVLARQAERGDRFTVAVVAAGEGRGESIRFAVEDLLAAGAIVDALAVVGIDYCSPEAAAAGAAYTSLRKAAAHLISASESGLELGMPMLDLTPVAEAPLLTASAG